MKRIINDKKAITLIALVITIVILVILAAVTISMTVGNDGLIAKAIKAANDYKNSKTQEQQGINDLYGELVIAADGTIENLTTTKLEEIIDSRIATKTQDMQETITELKNGIVPIGTVIAYYTSTAPTGYIPCDGTVYDLTQDKNKKYKELAKKITGQENPTSFTAPDLRGEFLRGTGSNSHKQTLGANSVEVREGDGAAVGTHQASTSIIPGYWSAQGVGGWYTNGNAKSFKYLYGNADRTVNDRTNYYETGSTTGYSQTGVASILTRPTNTSVLYCIKY